MMQHAASDVSLLGLGATGMPMAPALATAGWQPTVWNRTAANSARSSGSTCSRCTAPRGA